MEERTNIRILKMTHRRLNFFKGQMGMVQVDGGAPTLDEVINAGLDLLEKNQKRPSERQAQPLEIDAVMA